MPRSSAPTCSSSSSATATPPKAPRPKASPRSTARTSRCGGGWCARRASRWNKNRGQSPISHSDSGGTGNRALTPIFLLELHDVQVQLALADVLRRVRRARVDLPNLACLPHHLFFLSVGIDALERAALQGAHDADGGRCDAFVLGAGRGGHLVGLRLVVIEQYFHLHR